jgi:putative glutamine transport system permease protein
MAMINQILTPWRWQELFKMWPMFAKAFLTTLEIAVCALILALTLGIIFGLMSTSHSFLLRAIARVYVEFFQNTPLAIQVFFVFYAFPYAGIVLSEVTIGILCVGLYTGAYMSECVRAGIGSIPKGQFEAASSQGFTYIQTMTLIILPQTIKIILPPMINQMVNLVKNTSIVTMIGGTDLMYRANSYATNGYMSYGPSYLVCGILYFILCIPLTTSARRYEEKLKKRDIQTHDDINKTDNTDKAEGAIA